MAYGTIKIDTITFTDGGVDKSVSISGLVQNPTFSGDITVTGTVSGNTIRGQTVSGVTVTGTTALFSTGTFISLTGTTSQGTTATYTSGSFTSLTGVTTSGTTANFVSGVFSTQISGTTVTGNAGAFTTLTGGVTTVTSGVFAAGSASNPSISFTSDPNTGIYSPGADQVAISTGGSGRLFVDASGRVSVGENFTSAKFSIAGQGSFLTGAGAATNKGTVVIQDVGISGFTSDGGIEFKASSFGNGYGARILCLDGGELLFGNRANSSAWSERLRITSAGLVGVGTSSPGQLLSVDGGNIALQSSAGTVGGRTTERQLIRSDTGSTNGMAAIGMNGAGTNGFLGEIKFYTGLSDVFNASLSERARIDSSGRLLVGTSSTRSVGTVSHPIQQETPSGTIAGISIVRNSADGAEGRITFGKTRSTSTGGTAAVANGDYLGTIAFAGANGSDLNNLAASIAAIVDGDPTQSATDLPGRLVFSTTADGASSPTERMRIGSNGNVTIQNEGDLYLASADNTVEEKNLISWRIEDGSEGARISVFREAVSNAPHSIAFFTRTSGGLINEKARIDSSGRLLVGNSSAVNTALIGAAAIQVAGGTNETAQISISRYSNNSDRPRLAFLKSRSGSVGTNTILQDGDCAGEIAFLGADGSSATGYPFVASIGAHVDGTPGTNDMPGRLVFSTTADGASSPTERMRITSAGAILIAKTADDINTQGIRLSQFGVGSFCRDAEIPLFVNRNTDDGGLVVFRQAGVDEGSISVSGTTVSYNGAHLSRWSQLPSGAERTEILRGTVLSNIDEMCEWGDEGNEQLNRMKVSDVEGDKNVSGVFQGWDDDDDTYTNDFYCAMTGDFIIRIAPGVTVERGDLLMSAGDGTAKPQGDDIIRSKTVAKITSTNVSCTYDDGSYCVPCVLMAC